jgi:uncharacterized membrane protein YdfJ with MMPL/SSD domain
MVACVYGCATAIFVRDVLDGSHSSVFTGAYGLMWLVPILCFPILVGIGLDFEVFLQTRILDERLAGWDDASAIVLGLERSGPVVTWAGLIMAIAFAGLFSASLPLLNQLAFFIVYGVVLDTFFVRLLIVPSALACLDKHNWWPCEHLLPRVTRRLPELQAGGGVLNGGEEAKAWQVHGEAEGLLDDDNCVEG